MQKCKQTEQTHASSAISRRVTEQERKTQAELKACSRLFAQVQVDQIIFAALIQMRSSFERMFNC